MQRARWIGSAASALAMVLAPPALAAGVESAVAELDGAHLSLLWGIPFAGLLLSIALVPLVSARFWHRHYGKFALFWSLALLVPLAARSGAGEAWHYVVHAIVLEYVPFVVILFALYTIAGGICVHGHVAGTPGRNTALLALGAALFVLVPQTSGSQADAMSRVLQGVIAGIGFLGAGTILKGKEDEQGQHVKGLTTAAGLWMTAAIGVAAGMGRESTAVLSTLLALAVFSVMPRIVRAFEHDDDRRSGE